MPLSAREETKGTGMKTSPPSVKKGKQILIYGAIGVLFAITILFSVPLLLPNIMFSQDFLPHGHCYLWEPALVWLHVISDSLIGIAYVSIPATLLYFVKNRKDLPFQWMFLSFAIFIIACGGTHFMEVWTGWMPAYWLSGIVKE